VRVVYAESSAVLAWLLDEPRHKDVIRTLAGADRVVTSVLTSVECGRSLIRAAASGRLGAAAADVALGTLDAALTGWNVMDMSDDVIARARFEFPHEPVRTLDAIHLATATVFLEALGSLEMLSLDERVRENARANGMTVVPAALASAT
jgi:hypothetical protein